MKSVLCEQDAQAIEEILARELDVNPEQLTQNARIVEDLGADSLTVMEIIMAIEDRFDLSIPDDRLEKVKSVGDLYEALAEALQVSRRS
jgi:acyl carrier protein